MNYKLYKKMRFLLLSIYASGIIVLALSAIIYCKTNLPDEIYIEENKERQYNFNLPVLGSVAHADNVVNVNFSEPFVIKAGENGKYQLDVKFLGIYNIKTINVNVVEKQQVILGGFPVGIYIKYDGIQVAKLGEITDYNGNKTINCKDKLQPGDYILEINGEKLYSKEQLTDKVKELKSDEIILTINRNNTISQIRVNAILCDDGNYRLGIWIRDDAQGIGTITYIKTNGNFGALGHGIADIDTGKIINSSSGKLYEAKIITVIPGQAAKPGELVGAINYNNKYYIGDIYENNDFGIFGNYKDTAELKNVDLAEIAYSNEIKKGDAYIRSYVDGNKRDYKIKITDINQKLADTNKGIEFTVTDEELLKLTNGIVQGMSGSPIIQDGKIIGAVTHVLVNDPTKGYGIFIENMLKH